MAQARAAILAAAEAGDYDALGEVIDPAVFLSDDGFGVDPVASWRSQGTLYRWPRFTANSDPEELSAEERQALAALLGEEGLRSAFLDETGYFGPCLGVLADGTWWIFVLQPGA